MYSESLFLSINRGILSRYSVLRSCLVFGTRYSVRGIKASAKDVCAVGSRNCSAVGLVSPRESSASKSWGR